MKQSKRMAAAMLAAVLSLNGAGMLAMHTAAAKTQTDEYAVTDVVALHKFLMGKHTLSKNNFQKMDMTGDGVIDAFDLAVMKRKMIEKRKNTKKITCEEIRTHITDALTESGWDAAFADESYVFTSSDQFETVLGDLVKPAVLRSLQKTYTEDFFKENVLCFKVIPTTTDGVLTVDTENITVSDSIEIPYSVSEENVYGRGATAVELVLSKKSCQEKKVVWKQKNTTPVSVKFTTESIFTLTNERNNGAACIYSQEEMVNFLSGTMEEEGIAIYQERYPESFFEENMLYMRLSWGHATQYALGSAAKCGDDISITLYSEDSYGCVEQALDIVEINKSDLGDGTVNLRFFNGMHSEIESCTEFYYGPLGNAVYVKETEYFDETDVELIYLHEVTIGCEPYVLKHCIKTVPMQESGYMPFTEQYEQNGDYTPVDDEVEVSEGEDFKIHWRYDGVMVELKTSSDAETYEKVYIWEDPYSEEYFCYEHEKMYCEECYMTEDIPD